MENIISELLLAALVGLGSVAVFMIGDTRKTLKEVSEQLLNHMINDQKHCSPEKQRTH